jgi:glycosyltransferase involved in cell wall biosynthesis
MAPGPILFSTRSLDAHTGVAQAALDVALALSLRSGGLRVRAWVPSELPREIDGRLLRNCQWQPIPPLVAARAVLSGDAPPRALIEHTRTAAAALQARLLPGPAPVLEVVNGVGAHALHALMQAAQPTRRAHRSALIVHESPRHFEPSDRTDLAAAMAALRSYDYRVFVSDRVRREWQTLLELDPSRSFYIPNCVREQRVASVLAQARGPLRRKLGHDPNGVQLVCVGAVSQRKGQDVVISALQALHPSTRPVYVDFLGDDSSPWAHRLKAQLRGTPLASRVRFLGGVSDVYERIFAADALVLASRAEAFPLAVLEAMALGTCVLATDVDGIAEQIIDEQTGLLFESEDVGALVGAIHRVARDAGLREILGRAGRARYLSLFTRERQLARWSAALAVMLREDSALPIRP